MDIQDLDFKEVFQKPVDLPFFACHIEGQLSNQELKTVVGGAKPVNTVVEVSKPALLNKIATQAVVEKKAVSVLDNQSDTDSAWHHDEPLCIPYNLPPYYICFGQSSLSYDERSR